MTVSSNRNAAQLDIDSSCLQCKAPLRTTRHRGQDCVAIAAISLCVAIGLVGCGKAPQQENSALAKANQQFVSEDFPAALESVDAVLAADPDDYQAHLLRGQINFKTENFDEAIDDFSRARDIQPTTADAYQFRYKAYLKKAEEFPISSPKWINWSEMASADQKEFYRLDITSVAAQKTPSANFDRSQKLIEQTNEIEEELNALRNEEMQKKLLAGASSEPEPQGDDPAAIEGGGLTMQAEDPWQGLVRETNPQDDADQEGGNDPQADLSPQGIDQVAEQEAEKSIREQDLASNEQAPDDDPLQHGDDSKEQEDVEVLPQITRNDLGAYLPQSPIGPFGGQASFAPPTTGLNGNQSITGLAPNTGYGRFATGTTGIVSTPTTGQNQSQQTQPPRSQPSRSTGLNATPQPGAPFSNSSSPIAPPWTGSPSVTNNNLALGRAGVPSGQTGLGNSSVAGQQQFSGLARIPGTNPAGNGQRANQFGQQQAGFGIPSNLPFGPSVYSPGNPASGQSQFGANTQRGNREGAAEGRVLPKPRKLGDVDPISTALPGTGTYSFGQQQLPQNNPFYLPAQPAEVPAALLPQIQRNNP